MKPLKLFFCLALIAGFAAFKEDATAFDQLHALEGAWKMQGKRGTIYETWQKVNKVYLHNKSYMVKAGGDTMQLESVTLKQTNEGIFYTSTVPNQNDARPVSFKLTSSANKKFIFENREHDFPKRIVYQLVTTDSLHAFIDDGNDASAKRSHYYFNRI